MRLQLHLQNSARKTSPGLFQKNGRKPRHHLFFMLMMLLAFTSQNYAQDNVQGTWTALTNLAPHANGGVMLVLSDGTVMCKTFFGGADGFGNRWDRLVPNALLGSYSSGTWQTNIAAMHNT